MLSRNLKKDKPKNHNNKQFQKYKKATVSGGFLVSITALAQSLNLIHKFITMKKYMNFIPLFLLAGMLTSCEAVETIFKAGMWWGIIVVVGIVALVLWLLSRGKN